MDLTVEQKEAVTEELYSVLAQTPGSAGAAEAWLWHHIISAGCAAQRRHWLSFTGR